MSTEKAAQFAICFIMMIQNDGAVAVVVEISLANASDLLELQVQSFEESPASRSLISI